MSKIFRIFMILVIATLSLPATTAHAAPIPTDKALCESKLGIYGSTPDGSNFCLWLPPAPTPYVGDALIFAHGYTDPQTPDGAIPWDQLALTTPTLPEIVVGQLKTAFAVTSYAHNGLAVGEGVTAVTQLAVGLKAYPGLTIKNVYLVGASEGGLVTTLAIEQNPGSVFSGGVATCGPIGDFQAQVNYWGDFRVVFDYFFQSFRTKLAGPIWIKDATHTAWGTLNLTTPTPLQAEVIAALMSNPAATMALLNVSKAPYDPAVITTVGATVLGILDYNVHATNQARMELSGNATLDGSTNEGNSFGNNGRLYSGNGEASDALMNAWIQTNDSFTADPAALAVIQAGYQTTSQIKAPLVIMHTTGDPIVPFWHASIYQKKIWAGGNGSNFFSIPITRYGHCAFTAKEAVFSFIIMAYKATGTLPTLPEDAGGDPSVLTRAEFTTMQQQYSPYNLPAPTLNSIVPNSGPAAGGTSVVITGANLTGANLTGGSVTFGGTAATCTVDSATQITCTSPAHAAGAVDVVVTTLSGAVTSTGGFTYITAPTLTSIVPNSGPVAGGTSVVITGANLTGGSVTFGGTAATCTVDSATQITCTSPAHAAGAVNVVVTTMGGKATSTGGFTYKQLMFTPLVRK